MTYSHLFIDLDDTIYASGNGLWSAIGQRMNQFMVEILALPPEQVPSIRRSYFEIYGTTLRGLQIHHQVDADEFLAYVHDLPLREFLHPDPELGRLLQSLPQGKWIFTNADAAHAGRVLSALGVQDCFDGIIDIRRMDWHCKPEPAAYQQALLIAGENRPERCIILDDAPRNLKTARWMGFYTILVSRHGPDPVAHLTIATLKQLPKAMPELWPAPVSTQRAA